MRFKTLHSAIVQENEFRRVAAIILEHVKSVSKSFVGKKVETQTGLTAKYAEALNMRQFDEMHVNPVPGATWARTHHVTIKIDGNSIYLEMCICFGEPKRDGCFYDRKTYYFGKLENGILISVNDLRVPAPDLDYNNELGKIMQFRKLEKELEEVKSSIRVGYEAYRYMNIEDF